MAYSFRGASSCLGVPVVLCQAQHINSAVGNGGHRFMGAPRLPVELKLGFGFLIVWARSPFKYRGKKHAACSRSGGFTVPCRRGNCVPPAPWACRCFLLARSSGDPFHGRFPSTERVLRRRTLMRSLGVRRGALRKFKPQGWMLVPKIWSHSPSW